MTKAMDRYLAYVAECEDAVRARLAELRVEAARRRDTMSHAPDTAEEIAGREAERDGLLALQSEAWGRR